MKRPSFLKGIWFRAWMYGALPLILGLGGAQAVRWADTVWMTDAGPFWPFTLTVLSAGIVIRLIYGDYKETTSAVMAWLVLSVMWFYAPMWATAVEVPITAAVVSRDGVVHIARDAVRTTDASVRFLTDRPGTRIVRNVVGKNSLSELEIEFAYAKSYIGTRRSREDLAPQLVNAAAPILAAAATATRASKIALFGNRKPQDAILAQICRAAVDDAGECPIKMKMAPTPEAAAIGGLWSTQYSESEAIEERHLPSLVQLLTRSEPSPAVRDKVVALVLDLASSGAELAQVAQRSQLLTDEQFDLVIKRILLTPNCNEECGDAAAVVATVNRLSDHQRRALRAKAVDAAGLSTILANAATLRITDAEVARLASRVRQVLRTNPAMAVRALNVFGDRLPQETQRDAVDGILVANAAYALSALERFNFSPELRGVLVKKVLSDAQLEDFATSGFNKSKLQEILAPHEMRALIEMSVKRSDSSERWHTFAVDSFPISGMSYEERRRLLNGMIFKSPKAALEFASTNRDFLDPNEVAEVTRDYSRTVTRDFCLHLSHRNKNWKQNYFSEAQLEIFRECAAQK